MNSPVIASQLPDKVNQRLAELLPHARVVAIPMGTPAGVPSDATVLLAAPMRIHGRHVPDQAPEGWPWGLQWVQLMSSGIDAYPPWLFDLPVATARGSSAHAIAEFALAAILAAAKQLPQSWSSDPYRWNGANRPQLASVRGSTIGVVGFGAIGRAFAAKALALEARVVALRGSSAPLDLDGVQGAPDLRSLFAQADHAVIAAPLTPRTRGLVGAAEFAAAKPGLHLVNVSRGGLVDHEALLRALDSGAVGLASLDVTEPEPLPAGHPFYLHPRVRLSPHIAGSSPELFDNVLAILLRNLEAADAGRPLENQVARQSLATH